MTRPAWIRPAPGTSDLLEVLDRALTGGIVIGSERRIHVVTLRGATRRARLVVTAAETYVRHPVKAPPGCPETVNTSRVEKQARRSG